MIVSNEPGYYKTGAYGIRIENLAAVTESPKAAGEEREMLVFETLTLAPIDRRLIERHLLGAEDAEWLDASHARIGPATGPQHEGPARARSEAAQGTGRAPVRESVWQAG